MERHMRELRLLSFFLPLPGVLRKLGALARLKLLNYTRFIFG